MPCCVSEMVLSCFAHANTFEMKQTVEIVFMRFSYCQTRLVYYSILYALCKFVSNNVLSLVSFLMGFLCVCFSLTVKKLMSLTLYAAQIEMSVGRKTFRIAWVWYGRFESTE